MTDNFAIRMKVDNFIQKRNPIMFDAVLAALSYEKHGDANRAIEEIPLIKINGITCSSQVFLETVGQLRKEPIKFCSSVHKSVNNFDLFDRLAKFDIGRDPVLQNTEDTYEVLYPEAIWFMGQGDLSKVMELLKRITRIGAKRTSGFGRVSMLEVFKTNNPKNGLYFTDKSPQRMFPLHMLTKETSISVINVIDTPYQPPYYLPNSQPVCFTPRHNVFSQEQLLSKMAVTENDLIEVWRTP